jgi:hypothetical protein
VRATSLDSNSVKVQTSKLPTLIVIRQCESDQAVFQLFDTKRIVTYWDLSRAKGNKIFAHNISKHAIKNAFEDLPLSDVYQGMR